MACTLAAGAFKVANKTKLLSKFKWLIRKESFQEFLLSFDIFRRAVCHVSFTSRVMICCLSSTHQSVQGTIVGSIFSFIMMESITTNQREVLLSIEGTNVWSGQMVQSFNSQAIA
jgi:hypothetical protein